MREVVIDNNAIDPFVDVAGAYDAALAAVERGDLRIWYVHTTMTEAANTPDKERRDQLLLTLASLGNLVASTGFVLDESRSDHFAPTDDAGAADLESLASGHLYHKQNRRDALVANTAKANGWAVLTRERKRLRNRTKQLGVEVLSIDDLFAEIGFTPSLADT